MSFRGALNVRYSHCSNRCRVSVRFVSFGRSVNFSFNKVSVVVVLLKTRSRYLFSSRKVFGVSHAGCVCLALQSTETAIQESTIELPLSREDIMDSLNLCLTSTYFQYNGKHYKQLHGTAMGSPVSVVIAEIVMQHVEERALATCRQTIPLWLLYVDDTFTAVHKDEIDS